MAVDDRYLTAQEAADYLGVSKATLYAYVSRGLVSSEPPESTSAGRSRRYPRWTLDELKARREERRDPAAGALRLGAPVLDSALSLIEGGRLWYRGRDACELSRTATLEEVAALLWADDTQEAGALFPASPSRRARRGHGSAGDRLIACLVAERARHPLSLVDATPATLRAAGATISALFAAVGATGAGTLAERLARGWRAPSTDDLRAALVLCADHGLSTSAFTARCVASTDAPIQNALLAALLALEGRRHGGVTTGEVGALLDDIEQLGAEQAYERALARSGWIPGFVAGTPPYPSGDPRAAELLARLELSPDNPATQAIAFAAELGAGPALELALAALERHAELPRGGAFALFALGRSVGWVAHALEEAASGRLIRPRARYTGPAPTPS